MSGVLFRRLSTLLILVAMFIAGTPQKTHALGAEIVYDPTNFVVNSLTSSATSLLSEAYNVKEGIGGSGLGLDTIGWTLGKVAIQTMTKSVVNWINSGFNGSPAFATDLSNRLLQVADEAAGSFITTLLNDPLLRSPFQSRVAQTVAGFYYLATSENAFAQRNRYTLHEITPYDVEFLNGDFAKGGFEAWFWALSGPQNNPYGAQMLAEQELARQISEAVGVQITELDWGNGFLSWRECEDKSGTSTEVNLGTPPPASGGKNCGPIETPGSVIQSQINQTLGLTGDQLVSADEINEVVSALMSQLVTQVLGGTGLSGVSSVSSGGRGFIDQAASSTQYTNGANSPESILTQSVFREVQKMVTYQESWRTIKTVAAEAVAKNNECTVAAETLARAEIEIERAEVALAALQNLQARIIDGAIDGTIAVDEISAELSALLANPATPSATDIAYATKQAAPKNGTLFTKLETVAETGLCFIL